MSNDESPQPDDPHDDHEPTDEPADEAKTHRSDLQDPDADVTANTGSEHLTGESYRNTLRLN